MVKNIQETAAAIVAHVAAHGLQGMQVKPYGKFKISGLPTDLFVQLRKNQKVSGPLQSVLNVLITHKEWAIYNHILGLAAEKLRRDGFAKNLAKLPAQHEVMPNVAEPAPMPNVTKPRTVTAPATKKAARKQAKPAPRQKPVAKGARSHKAGNPVNKRLALLQREMGELKQEIRNLGNIPAKAAKPAQQAKKGKKPAWSAAHPQLGYAYPNAPAGYHWSKAKPHVLKKNR